MYSTNCLVNSTAYQTFFLKAYIGFENNAKRQRVLRVRLLVFGVLTYDECAEDVHTKPYIRIYKGVSLQTLNLGEILKVQEFLL